MVLDFGRIDFGEDINYYTDPLSGSSLPSLKLITTTCPKHSDFTVNSESVISVSGSRDHVLLPEPKCYSLIV